MKLFVVIDDTLNDEAILGVVITVIVDEYIVSGPNTSHIIKSYDVSGTKELIVNGVKTLLTIELGIPSEPGVNIYEYSKPGYVVHVTIKDVPFTVLGSINGINALGTVVTDRVLELVCP